MLAAGRTPAHEIQPSIADVLVTEDSVDIAIRLTLEAPVAGVDLAGLANTDDAENAAAYDRLRGLSPDALEEELRRAWPLLASRIVLETGGERLRPELQGVDIPPVGNIALPRYSLLRLSAALPPGDDPVVFGWASSLGALVVREQGVAEGYTGYLTGGALSDPIPRGGGDAAGALATFAAYVGIGFQHIVPLGLDHVLFVLGLFFLSLRLGPLLWQVSAFTLAHTVTLALGALGLVTVPAAVVEPLIAASIVYVAVENIFARGLSPWRTVVVFLFGLMHGLGFAAVLGDIGLEPARFVTGLIGFNLGVELGQLAILAAAFLGLGVWFGARPWYTARIAHPASAAIAVVGAWWFIERTLL